MHVFELMEIEEHYRGHEWLVASLGAAVELELATLPPYLTALWSIDDGYGPATAAITNVVKEEMLHMVLAGNMLSAVGGHVELKAPTYPGGLPGDVIPGLEVPLTRLSLDTLENTFMAIEFPEDGPVATAPDEYAYDTIRELYDALLRGGYPTIGAFYDAIWSVFCAVSPDLRSDHQLSGTVGGHAFGPTDTPDKFNWAITTISEQGEGTKTSAFTDPAYGSELSHFYRFAEIFHGRRIIRRHYRWVYEGDPVPFPIVSDMAPVPKGGYTDQADEVQQLIDSFNRDYTQILDDLQAAWAQPHDTGDLLGKAVGQMFGLEGTARKLMTMWRPDGSGTYGPDWRCQR